VERSEAFKILIKVAAASNEKIREDLKLIENALPENAPWFAAYDALINRYEGFSTPKDIDPGITLSQRIIRQEGADIVFKVIEHAGLQPQSRISSLKERLALVPRREEEEGS
jgi:hypothetical protein